MVGRAELRDIWVTYPTAEYECRTNLNLYDSPALTRLATQAVAGRQLRILSLPPDWVANSSIDSSRDGSNVALSVRLREDDYPGWISAEDLDGLERAETPYQPQCWTASDIQQRLPLVIQYTRQAMQQPNHYLWGGAVGPNYDCSGLMQAAFLSAGIWIPRDAYQQEAFAQAIALDDLQPGDLVFFGPPAKATHVGLYLGDRRYIHSSGKEIGRNGIGIDVLSDEESDNGDGVSRAYYRQLRGAGRIVVSYEPETIC